MTNTVEHNELAASPWSPIQVYAMAALCLILGVALGYLFRGSQTPGTAPSASGQAQAPMSANLPQQMPTLDQMKHMADKQAEPLLAQLKTDPKNADLLKQMAKIYESTHQFKEAAGYYEQALALTPKDVATRTEMASCLYYSGDVDGALTQLQRAVADSPKDANSLFNLGMIRWKGKSDVPGALQAWEQLLRSNPNMDSAKRKQVQDLIAQVKQPSMH